MRFLVAFVFLISWSAHAAETVTWETLAPASGAAMIKPQGAMAGAPDRSTFDGSDEEWKLFLEDLTFMKEMQPQGGFLNSQLDGRQVRIAGYITPVGFDGEDVTEFLFVPFLGACIHVPPPDANQIIHVTDAKGVTVDGMWEPAWLTGTLKVKPSATVLADVGYRMEGGVITTWDGDDLPGETVQIH